VAANLLRSGTRGYLIVGPARALPLVGWIAAEGGQAMLEEVSVAVRVIWAPQAAAPGATLRPGGRLIESRDLPGW